MVPNDVLWMKFIPFALKDDVKRWVHYLKVGSIESWDCFVDVILKEILSTSEAIRISNEILAFVPIKHEPFRKYMNRFEELLTQCSYHGLGRENLCQINYDGRVSLYECYGIFGISLGFK